MDGPSQQAYLGAIGIPLYRYRRGAGIAASPEPLAEEPAATPPSGDGPLERSVWEGLQGEVAHCTACPLHETRTQTVFGVGDPGAKVMFVGEAPGGEEDRQGAPFVGRAGRLLDAMLAAIGLDRRAGLPDGPTDKDGVFIANVLKCRPPRNRDPKPGEVAACEGYLRRQIDLVAPEVIVALGRVAGQDLTQSQKPLARLREQVHTYHDTLLLVTYHPAYLLRNPADKAKAWQDLKAVRRRAAVAQPPSS